MKIVFREKNNFIIKLEEDFIYVRFFKEKVLTDYSYYETIDYNRFKWFVGKSSKTLLEYQTVDLSEIIKNYIRKEKLRKLLS